MASIFSAKAIKPEPFSSARVRAYILNAIKKEGKRSRQLLELTVEYWNRKPKFVEKIYYRNASPILHVGPDAAFLGPGQSSSYGDAGQHWIMIDEGHATFDVMTPDFKPKTDVPGGFGTNNPGAGGFSHVNPGKFTFIRPRNWSESLTHIMQDEFTDEIQSAIEKGLQPK